MSLGPVTGACHWGVSLGPATGACHWGVSLGPVSGSPTIYFPFILLLSAFLMKKNKIQTKKIKFNLVSGSLPMLYKLVLGPAPILHTNVHENPLTTFGFTDILKLFN